MCSSCSATGEKSKLSEAGEGDTVSDLFASESLGVSERGEFVPLVTVVLALPFDEDDEDDGGGGGCVARNRE